MKKIINVDIENANKRIDVFLSKIDENYSRTTIQKMIENEKISVNGQKIRQSYKVQVNDKIEIEEEPPKEIELKPQEIPLEILYEDNDIIVINKPKGMVVHPANGNPDGTLVNAVMAVCKNTLSGIGGEIRPGIVHRLDKNTSGAIIVAKNDKAHIKLSEQLKNHEIEKTYIALVRGIVKENNATINMPIGRFFENNCTLLEIKIETGRTHQIRVHLSYIGYPIIGDDVYSNGKNKWDISGQCLHAKSLKFKHPITGKELYIKAGLPEYFENVITELKHQERKV